MTIYIQLCEQARLVSDVGQIELVHALDRLYQALIGEDLENANAMPTGIYISGNVGRGKTFLMQLFYEHVTGVRKYRAHFHRFMAEVHNKLTSLQGNPQPLDIVAKAYADQYGLICIDEFFVEDIGDAMILHHLLKALFSYNVVFVFTSNVPISDLYKDGLQRGQFLPAISLLEDNMQEVNLVNGVDYRLGNQIQQDNYFVSKSNAFSQRVKVVVDAEKAIVEGPGVLLLYGREVPYRKRCGKVIVFSFAALCDGPRSTLDYIELARYFNVIFLENIPVLGSKVGQRIIARGTEDNGLNVSSTAQRNVFYGHTDNAVRRFIALVDELYDNGIKLFVSADVPMEILYTDGSLLFEFRRTYSRLVEMGTDDYLQRCNTYVC